MPKRRVNVCSCFQHRAFADEHEPARRALRADRERHAQEQVGPLLGREPADEADQRRRGARSRSACAARRRAPAAAGTLDVDAVRHEVDVARIDADAERLEVAVPADDGQVRCRRAAAPRCRASSSPGRAPSPAPAGRSAGRRARPRTWAFGRCDWITSTARDWISALASWIDCHDGSSVIGVMKTSAPNSRSRSVNGLSNGASTDTP